MKTSLADRYEQVYVKDRKAWRAWLSKHHATSPGILLVYLKKAASRTPRLDYADAVEEALCFGWIDSTLQPLDSERYMQLFTPRKPKSGWSRINKKRVEDMIAQKLMKPVGLAKIEAAKKDGSWTKLDAVENLEMPAELKKALAARKGAAANFKAFTPGAQKQMLYWLNNAKLPATRAKRVGEIVSAVAEGRSPREEMNGESRRRTLRRTSN